MKSIRTDAVPRLQAVQEPAGARGHLSAGICALSMLLASTPLLENRARADNPLQPVPRTQAASQPSSFVTRLGLNKVSCTSVQINDKRESLDVCEISRQRDLAASIELKGPARVLFRFYPTVRLERFKTSDSIIPWTVKYSVIAEDGKIEERSHEGKTSMSNFRTPEIDHTVLTLGTGMPLAVRLGKGTHTVSFSLTNGFMQILSKESIREKKTAPKPLLRHPVQKRISSKPAPKPLAAAINGSAPKIPRFIFEAEREWLHRIGSQSNPGDLNRLRAAVNIHLPRNLALRLGLLSSSLGLQLEKEGVRTSLRSLSADAMVGLVILRGKHELSLGGYGGYRLMFWDIAQNIQPNEGGKSRHEGEFGGMAGYRYGHAFEAFIEGSNNEFCPLLVRLRGELPFRWVKGTHIWGEGNVLWLHALIPLSEEGLMGGVTLREDNAYASLMAGIPVWKAGYLVPSVLAGASINASEAGFHYADLVLGADFRFEKGRLMLSARGGAHVFGKVPFVQIGMHY